MKENKVVKVFYGEDEISEFRELEALIGRTRPEFVAGWEKELAARIAREKKASRFFLRSAVAASLLVMALLSSFFYRGSAAPGMRPVTDIALSEVLTSVGGNAEPGLDEILSGWENGDNTVGDHYNNYIQDTLGGTDEETIS